MVKKKVKIKDLKKTADYSYLYPYLLLFFLTLLFYWDLIFSNKVLNAQDLLTYYQYTRDFSRKEIFGNFSFPLWFPNIFGGMPSISSLYNFYPFSLLFLVFPVNLGINLFTAFHTFLAGALLYLYMRGIGIRKFGSLISALTFMFSAYFISRAVYCGHETKISTIVWIPLVFFFFDKGLRSKKISWFALSGAAMGLELLSAHIQIVFYTGIAMVVYALFGLYWMKQDRISLAFSNPVYLGFAAMAGVCLMASAVQLLPAYEYSSLSSRAGGTSYEFATSWSLPPEEILTYILPGLKGLKLSGYYGRMPMSQATPYLGILPLLMAGIAIIFKRDRYVFFFIALCGIALFIALGKYNPFYILIYKYIPGFNLFRVPQMILVLAAISIAALAGIGCDYILEPKKEKTSPGIRRYLLFFSVLAVVLAIALCVLFVGRHSFSVAAEGFFTKAGQPVGEGLIYERYMDVLLEVGLLLLFLSSSIALIFLKIKGKLDHRIIKGGVFLVLLFDLWYVDYKFMETIPANNVSIQGGGVIDFLKKDKDYFRVLPAGNLPGFTANKWSYFGLQSLAGYHAAPLGYYSNYMDKLALNNSLPDLLNAKYIILTKKLPAKLLANDSTGFNKYELVYNGEVKVYRNKKFLPRAFIAHRYKVVKDEERMMDILAGKVFPQRDVVLFSEEPAKKLPPASGEFNSDEVKILKYSSNRIELEIFSESDGILLLNEVYYPGWKAYIDGSEVEVLKADYLLRSIFIGKGRHSVDFVFRPLSLTVGAIFSILAFMFVVPVAVWQIRKQKKEA